MVKQAHKQGSNAIAITDHECISGHIKALQQGKKIREENPDFKVLLGNEIYLTNTRDKGQRYYHFLLIAKDEIGYRQIRELSSIAWKNSFFDRRLERTVTLKSDIEQIIGKNKGHVIASTACLGSEFAQLTLNYIASQSKQDQIAIHDFVTWCLEIFGEDFYIEIQPSQDPVQIAYNQKAVQIAKAYGVETVVTCDVHYLNKNDRSIHSAYLNSKDEERETADFYAETYMKTEQEVIDGLSYLDKQTVFEAIANTVEIANKCQQIDMERPVVVPELDIKHVNLQHIFSACYTQYEYIDKFANSEHIQDRYFLELVEKGFIAKNQEFNAINLSRINTELEELWEISERLHQRVSAYYTLTEKVVDIMWDDKLGNSLVGVARGSVTGFYTCYLMGITQLNPIQYNLPHWRHLHKSRPEMPKQNWAYKVNV